MSDTELKCGNWRVYPGYLQYDLIPGVSQRIYRVVGEEVSPAELEPPVDPPEPPAAYGLYIVKAGDGWWRISHDYGLTIDELVTFNDFDTRPALHPGDVLKVPTIAAQLELLTGT